MSTCKSMDNTTPLMSMKQIDTLDEEQKIIIDPIDIH